MIFLGWDKKINKKGWFVKLVDDKPVVDWFNESSLYYVKFSANDKATPNGTRIAYGRFVGKTRQPLYHQEIDKETLEKFGGYLGEVIEKFKQHKEAQASEQK